MASTNFNLRGIDLKVMALLKQEADKQRTSVNLLILHYIKQSVGYSHTVSKPTYHDLDHLAGSWKAKESREFKKNTSYFEKIDKDLWS